jgi:hypothetical protein
MGEQAQRREKIEDSPHYQNRERDQRGEDYDVWRIAGGNRHGVSVGQLLVEGQFLSSLSRLKERTAAPMIGLLPRYGFPLGYALWAGRAVQQS